MAHWLAYFSDKEAVEGSSPSVGTKRENYERI